MESKMFITFSLLICQLSGCQGANILFFFGISTYSHRITAWPLVEALADKGHSVTFLMPEANKNPNPKIKEIVPNTGMAVLDFLSVRKKFGPAKQNLMTNLMLPVIAAPMCNTILEDPEMIEWINSSHYDLVVVDALVNDCAFGLAYKWKAKTILFGTSSVFDWWPDVYGFPFESSSLPGLIFGYFTNDVPLPFFDRFIHTLGPILYGQWKVMSLHAKIEPVLREKLNIPDMPPIAELESNVSLVLMNSHYSEESARSLPPLIVPIGGMHCTTKSKPLPKEMESFINGSGDEGFIYVSFGSTVTFKNASQELTDVFFNAFSNTKIRFVWKWDGLRAKNMPSNIFTAEWMPQQAILSHPKIRAFITHGGLLSMQEAIFNGVPMISFPVFAEQDYNSERLHRTKRGIRLEITTITQEQLEGAIKSILTDDTYLKNVRKASVVFKDRPQTPLETAVWWTDYVLRHDDTSNLRPLAVSQTWFQRRLLDVWGFIVLVTALVLWIFVFILKKIIACIFLGKRKSASQKKTKVKKN